MIFGGEAPLTPSGPGPAAGAAGGKAGADVWGGAHTGGGGGWGSGAACEGPHCAACVCAYGGGLDGGGIALLVQLVLINSRLAIPSTGAFSAEHFHLHSQISNSQFHDMSEGHETNGKQ